jgi:hypothetical protein
MAFRRIAAPLSLIAIVWMPKLEAACSGSGTSWSCTAGTTTAQVNTAISSAADGATITFAAGAYSWGAEIDLSNSKGVTLQGAGPGSSVVTVTGTPIIAMAGTLSGNNTHAYRITGFTFQNAPANLVIWFFGPGTMNNIRIDHNTFDNFATGAIAIFFGENSTVGKFFGVIDHNTFSGPNNFMAMKVLGPLSPDQWPSALRGTASNIFLEDNTFNFTSASDLGSGCVDGYNGGTIVFRHNTVTNCLVTAHGTDHGGGILNFEIYANTLGRTSDPGSSWQDGTRLVHHQGSGEILVWNNVFKHATNPISSSAISVTHYRSASPAQTGDSGYVQCNGTAAAPVVSGDPGSIDGNAAQAVTYRGWPCWLQPGRAPAGGSPEYGTLSPMYNWMNVDYSTGNTVPLSIDDPWGSYVSTHIVANRDYYTAVSSSVQTSATSPFNGTTGMGFGTLANRPTTCTHTTAPNGENTGGVAYWATDQGAQGTLYRCSATNTWTVWYVPYTYPHPQQGAANGGAPPAPPTSLQVTQLN